MESRIYIVKRIEGEYAYLCDEAAPSEELFIAMALLPFGTDEGSRLSYSDFEFVLL